jgi:octaprenyl-diphosphate synthase
VVLCYRRGSEEERSFWNQALEKGHRHEKDLEQAQRLMARHHAISDTVERARHYGDIARDALAIFPASPHKSALLEAIEFCISRVH